MRQQRRGAGLAAEAIAMARLARELRRQRLQRHRPAEPCVRCEIHAAHSTPANLAEDGVGPQHRARLNGVIVFEQVRGSLGDWLREKGSRPGVVFEQRTDFGADDGIVRRLFLEPVEHVGRLVLECGFEQVPRASALLGSHYLRGPPCGLPPP